MGCICRAATIASGQSRFRSLVLGVPVVSLRQRRFCLVLIKPSHYDDDGYVIQWLRSAIPSNTLAALYGLAIDSTERRVLGDDVDIVITAYDETNTRVRPKRIARRIACADGGMVGLVG